MPQCVRYDGAGDGHGCVSAWRIDHDNADDPVSRMRAYDAGAPAQCRLVGCHREGNRIGKLAVSRATVMVTL
jgi:hypothetical protein